MIRINLIREKTSPPEPLWPRPGIRLQWAPTLFFSLASIGMGYWYWQLSQMHSRESEAVDLLRQNVLQLKVGPKQLQNLQEFKQLLQQRIALIERLQSLQKGPVQLMNALIAAMPKDSRLYVESLTQREGVVEIEGRAEDVSAIGDLMAGLNRQQPLEEVNLDFWEEDEETLLKFGLTCEMRN